MYARMKVENEMLQDAKMEAWIHYDELYNNKENRKKTLSGQTQRMVGGKKKQRQTRGKKRKTKRKW